MRLVVFLILFVQSLLSLPQSDCPPTQTCTSLSNTPGGSGVGGQFGEITAATDGCLGGEHNSCWITVNILTSGTLEFTINPNVNANDFDFAVWGPNSACPPTNSPIRCSYAINNNNFAGPSDNGNTGISTASNSTHPLASENDNSEGAGGNGWVNSMNVIAGETYLILVDNFTTNSGFQISFGGSSTLNCSFLPIELSEFYGINNGTYNTLKWTTLSEINNDYFIIEKSTDGVSWSQVEIVDGAGSSSVEINYNIIDHVPFQGINYYRLTQVDFDGNSKTFDLISVNNSGDAPYIIRITDILGQDVDNSYQGLRLVHYSNGTIQKRIGN